VRRRRAGSRWHPQLGSHAHLLQSSTAPETAGGYPLDPAVQTFHESVCRTNRSGHLTSRRVSAGRAAQPGIDLRQHPLNEGLSRSRGYTRLLKLEYFLTLPPYLDAHMLDLAPTCLGPAQNKVALKNEHEHRVKWI
jgi:hypothetical protein